MDHPFEPLLYQSAALGQAQGSLLYQSLCAGGPCPLPSGELVDLWLFDGLRQRASPSQVGPTHRYHSSQTYDQPIGDLGIRLIGGFEAADTPEPHQYNLPSFAPLQTATVTHELLLLLGGDLCPFDLLFMGGHGPWLVTGDRARRYRLLAMISCCYWSSASTLSAWCFLCLGNMVAVE